MQDQKKHELTGICKESKYHRPLPPHIKHSNPRQLLISVIQLGRVKLILFVTIHLYTIYVITEYFRGSKHVLTEIQQ